MSLSSSSRINAPFVAFCFLQLFLSFYSFKAADSTTKINANATLFHKPYPYRFQDETEDQARIMEEGELAQVRNSVFQDGKRYSELVQYTSLSPVIKITTLSQFHIYVLQTPRNYSVVVLFNIRSRYPNPNPNSTLEIVRNNFELLACKYSLKSQSRSNLFIQHQYRNTGDMTDVNILQTIFFLQIFAQDIPSAFFWMGLTTVPTLAYFSPEAKLNQAIKFNGDRSSFNLNPLISLTRMEQWLQSVVTNWNKFTINKNYEIVNANHSDGKQKQDYPLLNSSMSTTRNNVCSYRYFFTSSYN